MQEIIDRIIKLLALATSSYEHEAAAAVTKAQELLMEHNLKLEDIKTSHKSPIFQLSRARLTPTAEKFIGRGLLPMRSPTPTFVKCGDWRDA